MRVLIVKLSALGDVIHALPALRLLRRARRSVHVTWAVERRVAGVLEDQPGIDEVVAIDTRELRRLVGGGRLGRAIGELRRLRRDLRKPGFDLAVDLQGNIKSGIVLSQARCGRKVGLPRALCREAQNTLFTHDQAKVSGSHIVDQVGEVMAYALGLQWEEVEGPPLLVADRFAAAVEEELGPPPRVAFINGASWWTKQWPVANFIELGRRLADERGMRVILPWGDEGEHRRAEEIAAGLGSHAVVPDRTSLSHLAARLAACDLVVGGDTGPLHMAWAVGTSTVSLYGPNPSQRNGPRGESHRVLQSPVACSPCWGKECPTGHFICMEAIGVAQVVEAAADLLKLSRD